MFKKNKNSEFNKLLEAEKKKEKIKKEKVDIKWIILIVIIAFVLSFCLSYVSQSTIPKVSLVIGIIITLLFIFIGVLFDIVGVAVTSAEEAVFHSMNSRKVKGANIAVKFKKNADKVSSFCCDVIGDVCGVISGTASAAITVLLVAKFNFNLVLVGLIVTAIVSSLTIGGKAIGKSFAINKSEVILYAFSKFVYNFYKG